MSTIELEAQKACLVREILVATDERMINDICVLLSNYNTAIFPKRDGKRKIGILDGKAEIRFSDDFEMTSEELLNLQ
jgi:hypothetical protein